MNLQFKLCPKEFNRRLGPQSRLAISNDANLLAFSDREHQLLLYHRQNHRVALLHEGTHPITQLLFTRDCLLASEAILHEVFVFSLKSNGNGIAAFKLKKKLSSHRTAISKLDYNSNRQLILSQSNEACILWNAATLTKERTLNCSTSFFSDSVFTNNGQYLINLFHDTNVFFWRLDSFEHNETFVKDLQRRAVLAASRNQFLSVADQRKLFMANFVYDKVNFQEVDAGIAGNIEQVHFFDTLMLVRTSAGLFAGPVTESYKIQVKLESMMSGAKDLAISYSNDFVAVIGPSNDIFVSQVDQQQFLIPANTISSQENPMNNVACYCAGGFCNRHGCPNAIVLPPQHDLAQNEQMLQKIYKSALISPDDLKEFSREKLCEFLRRNHRFADKHRAITYKYLLQLPGHLLGFKRLMREGVHESTKMLRIRYPIRNLLLLERMKVVLSLLSHYAPVFAEADYLPCLVFPLVSVLGEDELLCFEVLHRLLTYWLQFLFNSFPVANAEVLQNIEQLLEEIDPTILEHFRKHNLSFTKLAWQLLSSFFSDVLNRQNYLSLVDSLFCNRQSPQLVFFTLIAFVVHMKPTIFSLHDNSGLDEFLNSQHCVHIGKLLNTMHRLHERYANQVRYQFKVVADWGTNDYGHFDRYPRDAVEIYRSKRQLEQKDHEFELERERYCDIIHTKMEKVAIDEKRRIHRQAKLSEAHLLRFEHEQKNMLPHVKPDDKKRIHQLKQVIGLMQENVSTQEKVVRDIKDIPVALPLTDNKKDADHLDLIENKLIRMMISQPPQPVLSHLVQPLIPTEAVRPQHLMKTRMNAELSEGLRNITELERQNQQKRWEGELTKVYTGTK